MGFSGSLDFLSVPPSELDFPKENEPEATVEEDYSDEEMDVDELERRMWRDRMLLRRLKEQNKGKEGVDAVKQRQSQEQARRKKMSRAQDGILKYMLKMMEVCKAQGFVYGIIPEKGKPVSGASDNLRAWWKEKVRFDRNGPAAISNGAFSMSDNTEYDVEGVEDDQEVLDCKPIDISLYNSGMGIGMGFVQVQPPLPIKGEIIESDFIRKRNISDEPDTVIDNKIYTCEFHRCPFSDYRHGFLDRNARNNHQSSCPYGNVSPRFGTSTNCGMNENKSPVFSLPFAQPKSAAAPPPLPNPSPPQQSFNLSGFGLPDDGQKMISELMSFYDNNLHGNKGSNSNSINNSVSNLTSHGDQNQNSLHSKVHFDNNNFYGQGIGSGIGANSYQQNNVPMNQTMFPREEIQFDSLLDTSPGDVTGDFRFGSPFNLSSVDYTDIIPRATMETVPRQDSSIWFL
ncbi:hypothetical protein GIB67_037800 [Kingdonia uniflora]|uniref:Ethylene insensitive 3-like DNA-binding domain-containing protein n=1 Tax=Kingdonia uniflora TaxID=39325 RepID=A0A7J7LVD5_9MAGN|nr:hypothetical protein GIB67_037800 [Kingdonia uniflora]